MKNYTKKSYFSQSEELNLNFPHFFIYDVMRSMLIGEIRVLAETEKLDYHLLFLADSWSNLRSVSNVWRFHL